MINLPQRPEPRSRFLVVICVMVLMGLIGAQMFLNRAGAQKQEEKKVQTTTDPLSSVPPAATTKPTDKELKQKLTPEQYYVTQKCGTEPRSTTPTGTITRQGFTSMSSPAASCFHLADKFDSGSGWPSFTKPIAKEKVVEK